MKIKKLLSLGLAVITAITLTCGCKGEDSKETSTVTDDVITIKIGHTDSPSRSTNVYSEKLQEILDAKAPGRFKVEVFANGALGDTPDLVSGVLTGTVTMMFDLSSAITATAGPASTCIDLPYLYPSFEDWEKGTFENGGLELFNETISDAGYYCIDMYYNGMRNIISREKVYHNSDDFKGQKVRITQNDLNIKIWNSMGANPTPMAWGEVVTSLSQGQIDALDHSLGVFNDFNLTDIAPYVTITNHCSSPFPIICSKKWIESLDKADRDVLEEAVHEVAKQQRAEEYKNEQDYLATFEKNGATIYTLTDNEIAGFTEACQSVYDDQREIVGEEMLQKWLDTRP